MPVTATAKLRYVSIPPRKMRLVARMIKGLPVEKAIDVMNYTRRVAANHLAQTLKSAAANALSQQGSSNIHPEDLFVKEVFVDGGPAAKRIRFQSMGRVFRYKKRFCHVTVRLEEKRQKRVAPAATTGTGKPTAAASRTTKSGTAAPAAATKTARRTPTTRRKRPETGKDKE